MDQKTLIFSSNMVHFDVVLEDIIEFCSNMYFFVRYHKVFEVNLSFLVVIIV